MEGSLAWSDSLPTLGSGGDLAVQSAVVARLVDQPLALLGLILVLLLLAVLSRVRDGRRQVMAAWLPRLLLLRIAVVAALLAAALTWLGAEGEWLQWVGVAADLGLELALIDVVFTLIWRTLIVAGAFKRAPPEILRNILFFILMSLVLALSLGQRGMLTTFSSAAILGGLAFVLGPGASSQVGNLSSALALQVERQFAVGDWIEVAGRLGRVENISWSSTYLFDDQFRRTVVIPNAVVDREYLVNYSRPEVGDYKVEVRLGLPYEMPPGVALELLREVLEGHDAIPDPQNHDAILNAFSDSSIEYVLRFFIRDFSRRKQVRSDVMARIWYAVRRAGYSIPFPIVDLRTSASSEKTLRTTRRLDLDRNLSFFRQIPLLDCLQEAELQSLSETAGLKSYAPGEWVVRQGETGSSLYFIRQGACSVRVQKPAAGKGWQEVSRLGRFDFFGEMAALTGEVRSASVIALTHLVVLEIGAPLIRNVFQTNARSMQHFAEVMAAREAERLQMSQAQEQEFGRTILQKIRDTFTGFFV